MRLKGLTTAIDYAYLNVLDLTDVDYRNYFDEIDRHTYEAGGVHDRGARQPADLQPAGQQGPAEEGRHYNDAGFHESLEFHVRAQQVDQLHLRVAETRRVHQQRSGVHGQKKYPVFYFLVE